MACHFLLERKGVSRQGTAHGLAACRVGLSADHSARMRLLPQFLLPSTLTKTFDMKTWLLAAGLLGMVFTASAQKANLSPKGGPKTEVLRTEVRGGVFYGTLVAFKQTNTEIVRFNVDDVVMRMTRDTEFRKNLDDMTKYRFKSVGQALNVLASHGWEVSSTMVVRGRQGDERHFLMSYSTERISPVFPWLEREGDRNSQRQ